MEAAYTIWATVNVNVIAAIKDITIWQGIAPAPTRWWQVTVPAVCTPSPLPRAWRWTSS